jgi:hypothetical protein
MSKILAIDTWKRQRRLRPIFLKLSTVPPKDRAVDWETPRDHPVFSTSILSSRCVDTNGLLTEPHRWTAGLPSVDLTWSGGRATTHSRLEFPDTHAQGSVVTLRACRGYRGRSRYRSGGRPLDDLQVRHQVEKRRDGDVIEQFVSLTIIELQHFGDDRSQFVAGHRVIRHLSRRETYTRAIRNRSSRASPVRGPYQSTRRSAAVCARGRERRLAGQE